MRFQDSLPLLYSWPLSERGKRIDSLVPDRDEFGGRWSFDLLTGEVTWDRGLYELFGFPAGAPITRRSAADCYVGKSRAAMEQLRAHAIAHRRGFTLEVDIAPVNGAPLRRMRLTAAPVCILRRVIALEGLKYAVR